MKPFKNESNEGNEKAFRFGPVAPDDSINLAYVKSVDLSPDRNVVVVDTSRVADENTNQATTGKQIFFANELGILVDENGNAAVTEEYPVVTDVFSMDEDWRKVPGSEYTEDSILPYLHISRHLHLDDIGLLEEGDARSYRNDLIKIVDARGREYVDASGKPRYRTKITAVRDPDPAFNPTVWGYRVLAFVDTDDNEELYLTYSKVEMSPAGLLVNRQTGYRELLNPQPYFSFNPEESDVVDPRNRFKKQYSTKPIQKGNRGDVGALTGATEGYRVFVPRKAIEDKRIYQLFRWRIHCTFVNDDDIDTSAQIDRVRVGIVVTNRDIALQQPTRAPWALLNLERSRYNLRGVNLINPLRQVHTNEAKDNLSYWLVNIDTDDLDSFDLLLWAPNQRTFDVTPYSSKIDHFVRVRGGTLLFDTNNYVDVGQTFAMNVSAPVTATKGDSRPGGSTLHTSVNPFTTSIAVPTATPHPVIDGAAAVGGWDLRETENNNELQTTLSYTQIRPLLDDSPRYCQNIASTLIGYEPILNAVQTGSLTEVPVTVSTRLGTGYKLFTTFAQTQRASVLLNPANGNVINANDGRTRAQLSNYADCINSTFVEGAMKFLYNVVLTAAQGRALDDIADGFFSTRFTHTTAWQPSWVINGLDDRVLDDKEKLDYNFFRQERNLFAATPDGVFVWKRQISPFTTEKIVNDSLAPLLQNPVFESSIRGASRIYRLEVTNPEVDVPTVLPGADFPTAWTEAYSPRFEVPEDFGPHAIREEIDESGVRGRLASLDRGVKYQQAQYPPKPYAGRVTANFIRSEEDTVLQTATYSAQIEMRIKYRIETVGPAQPPPPAPPPPGAPDNDIELDVEYSHQYAWGGSYQATHQYLRPNMSFPNFGEYIVDQIRMYSEKFYSTNSGTVPLVYPYWGFAGTLADIGGAQVGPEFQAVYREQLRFLKDALNRFTRMGFMPGPIIEVNDKYDGAMMTRIADFQRTFQCKKQDGIADAETMFAIGAQIERARHTGVLNGAGSPPGPISPTDTSWKKYYLWSSFLDRRRLSDGDLNTWHVRRSDARTGANRIWDKFLVWFPDSFKTSKTWHGMRIYPFVPGDTGNQMIDAIEIAKTPYTFPAGHYTTGNSDNQITARLANMGAYVRHGYFRDFALPSNTKGNAFTVEASQTGSSGFQKAKYIGFRNIALLTREKRNLGSGTLHYHGSTSHRHGALIPHNHNGGPSATTTPGSSLGIVSEDYESLAHWTEENEWMDVNRKKLWTGIGPLTVGSTHFIRTAADDDDDRAVPTHYGRGGDHYERGDDDSSHYVRPTPTTQSGGSAPSPGSGPASSPGTGVPPTPPPPQVTVTYETRTELRTVTGSVSVNSFQTVTRSLSYPTVAANAEILSATWLTISVNNPYITAELDGNGVATFTNQTAQLDTEGGSTQGPAFPGGVFYSIDRNKTVDPIPEVGLVSKSEGMKLLSNVIGQPYGFPALPTDAGGAEAQYHYATLRLDSAGSHASVTMGFYDIASKEFVSSASGLPEMSYIEYIRRGPHNIYIAVSSDYEVFQERVVPNDIDAIPVPHKWAMPVYGVAFRGGSRIALQPLPERLDYTDVWPISVSSGVFDRQITVRERLEGPIAGYLNRFHGKTVTAFYGLPEAEELLPYSEIYGRPYVNVFDEQPAILDDTLLQVRQTPIASFQIPTEFPGPADPSRPAFTVYTRDSLSDTTWSPVPLTDIKDYNLSTGEIYLRNNLRSNDPRLLRVDYVTNQPHYAMKRFGGQLLNLNPYSEFARDLIGRAIYIYIVPHYVRDDQNNVIPESVQRRTLRMSFTPDVFDYFSANYDPLAIQLGVVYLSAALKPEEVTVLDTRRRGGGLRNNVNLAEVTRIVQEASTYWDISHNAGLSYPKSGYVIIRLPEELKDDFTENEIRAIISRNITAGIGFKIEDLQGGDWV